MITSWHRNVFRTTGICDGNPSVTDVFPSQRASNTERLGLLWYESKQAVEQTAKCPVILYAVKLVRRQIDTERKSITKTEEFLHFFDRDFANHINLN